MVSKEQIPDEKLRALLITIQKGILIFIKS